MKEKLSKHTFWSHFVLMYVNWHTFLIPWLHTLFKQRQLKTWLSTISSVGYKTGSKAANALQTQQWNQGENVWACVKLNIVCLCDWIFWMCEELCHKQTCQQPDIIIINNEHEAIDGNLSWFTDSRCICLSAWFGFKTSKLYSFISHLIYSWYHFYVTGKHTTDS